MMFTNRELCMTQFPRLSMVGAIKFAVCLMSMILLSDYRVLAADDDYRVTKVDWYAGRDEVVITYDLQGDPETSYEVSLVLLRENDKEFSFTPWLVKGDIGTGEFARKGNTIRWSYKNDFLSELKETDYYFEIRVERKRPFPWLVVGGGAAVGVVAYMLVTSKNESDGKQVTSGLPYPPTRP